MEFTMSVLLLNRQCTIKRWEFDSVGVVCEPRARVSAGWCAWIGLDPEDPYGLWRREFLRPAPAPLGGRTVHFFDNLPPGHYEAHSALRSRVPQSVYFRVTTRGRIKILGGSGDEDRLIAAFNGMTLDELHDAREAANRDQVLPLLEGSLKQAAWGALLRADLIRAAEAEGDDELVTRLRQIRDASWFIANRHRRPAELWGRLG
jgi:hypothetical protein